jgi:hypothetical protein
MCLPTAHNLWERGHVRKEIRQLVAQGQLQAVCADPRMHVHLAVFSEEAWGSFDGRPVVVGVLAPYVVLGSAGSQEPGAGQRHPGLPLQPWK